MITKFAGKWLTENIQEQWRVDPDPTKITIGMKKSDLVEPFCGWIAAATTEIKTRTAMIRRGWEKTGVMIAWSFGSEDRAAAVAEGQELHAKVNSGGLWLTRSFRMGRTRLVCHGAVQDLGVQAARAVGGFGENDQAEDADAAEPVDFALLGDNAAGGEEGEEQEEPEEKKKEEEKKEEKEEKKNGRKKKTKELVKEASS